MSFESIDNENKPEVEKLKIKVDKNESKQNIFYLYNFNFIIDMMQKKYDIINENILNRNQDKASNFSRISDIPVYIIIFWPFLIYFFTIFE